MRWPIHPVPIRGEALSSWLKRLAAPYDLSVNDLLVHDLGLDPLSERELDFEPPDTLFALLAERTGVAANRILRMTMRPMLSGMDEQLGVTGQKLFSAITRRYSILLPARRRRSEQVDDGWLPWVSNERFRKPWACELCLTEEEARPHVQLLWKLPITSTCPRHRVFLKPINAIGMIDLRPWMVIKRPVPETLLLIDQATEQAFHGISVALARAEIEPIEWMFVLRSLLAELNTSAADAGTERDVLRYIWDQCYVKPRAGVDIGVAYETLPPETQFQFLGAAALTIDLLREGKLKTKGADASLLRGRQRKVRSSVAKYHSATGAMLR